MYYEQYLQSLDWQELRQKVLQRDNNMCQTCCNTKSLEIHHKHYNSLGKEKLEDLITLCHECHEAITSIIRGRRYDTKIIKVEEHIKKIPEIKQGVEKNGIQKIELQNHRRSTPNYAQRTAL
jgi:5-methylcytosine-specific restriction endonuclease McrA